MAVIGGVQHLLRAQQDALQRRIQDAENSGRQAICSMAHVTTGVGELIVPTPVMFDCVFIEPPALTTGLAISRGPNLAYYRNPQVTAGAYRWVTDPPTGVAGNGREALTVGVRTPTPGVRYLGAYLYFNVLVEPINKPRGNGSNLAAATALRDSLPVGAERTIQDGVVAEAQRALDLIANPAVAVLTHHLVFTGVAFKKSSSNVVDQLKADIRLTPRTPVFRRQG